MDSSVTRRQVLGFRVRAQQLDRDGGTLAETAVLDIGVQDTGTDGALWALAIRRLPDPPLDDLTTVWTLRGAPHVYRRAVASPVCWRRPTSTSRPATGRCWWTTRCCRDRAGEWLAAFRGLRLAGISIAD